MSTTNAITLKRFTKLITYLLDHHCRIGMTKMDTAGNYHGNFIIGAWGHKFSVLDLSTIPDFHEEGQTVRFVGTPPFFTQAYQTVLEMICKIEGLFTQVRQNGRKYILEYRIEEDLDGKKVLQIITIQLTKYNCKPTELRTWFDAQLKH